NNVFLGLIQLQQEDFLWHIPRLGSKSCMILRFLSFSYQHQKMNVLRNGACAQLLTTFPEYQPCPFSYV
ncbi:hypothetical protein C2G38_2116514, partial [Gigaspora rosea]